MLEKFLKNTDILICLWNNLYSWVNDNSIASIFVGFLFSIKYFFCNFNLNCIFIYQFPIGNISFPWTYYLVLTIFRLSLNISSTRLILIDGYAGEVIETFGRFRCWRKLYSWIYCFLNHCNYSIYGNCKRFRKNF